MVGGKRGRKSGPSVLNDWEVAEVLHEALHEPYHVVARRHGISEKTVARWVRSAGRGRDGREED